MNNQELNIKKQNELRQFERRKSPRLEDNIFVSYDSGLRSCRFIAQNISLGGLMFESEKRISPGNNLVLEIYQPINQFRSLIFVISVKARVAWVKKIKQSFFEIGENKYKVGIEFIELQEEYKSKMLGYIREKRR
ncbi:PilZ domain-containing protein [Candidatus Omnitrophota bacterium]